VMYRGVLNFFEYNIEPVPLWTKNGYNWAFEMQDKSRALFYLRYGVYLGENLGLLPRLISTYHKWRGEILKARRIMEDTIYRSLLQRHQSYHHSGDETELGFAFRLYVNIISSFDVAQPRRAILEQRIREERIPEIVTRLQEQLKQMSKAAKTPKHVKRFELASQHVHAFFIPYFEYLDQFGYLDFDEYLLIREYD